MLGRRKRLFRLKLGLWLGGLAIVGVIGVIKLFGLRDGGGILAPVVISFDVNDTGEKKDTGRETGKIVMKISEMFKEASGVYSFYVYRVGEGRGYGVNEDRAMTAASMMKVPVMLAAIQEMNDGNLSMESEYILRSVDKIPGSGSFYYASNGTVLTVEEILEEMGKKSDNTALAIMTKLLGTEKIEIEVGKLGMKSSSFATNDSNAIDMAKMWLKVYEGEGMSEEQKEKLWYWLTDSIYEDRLALDMQGKAKVIHKVGTEVGVWADSGVIIPGDEFVNKEPYILVIMNEEIDREEAEKLVPEVARMIFEYETGRE